MDCRHQIHSDGEEVVIYQQLTRMVQEIAPDAIQVGLVSVRSQLLKGSLPKKTVCNVTFGFPLEKLQRKVRLYESLLP